MLFRRRKPERFWGRLRTWLWPRRSFLRSLTYVKKRILRLHATPHAIAAGVAAGVFASFTPLLGFHFILAFVLAYCLAGNMAAAALGTAVGNPLTFPAIWASTYEAGRYMLYAETLGGPRPEHIGRALMKMDLEAVWAPLMQPMLLGALPLGGGIAALCYGLVFFAARGFQRRRAVRLRARRHLQAAGRARERGNKASSVLPEV